MSRDSIKIGRRALLELIPATVFAKPAASAIQNCREHSSESAGPEPPYNFQFFTEAEARLLDAVMEKIIPGDDHSPGAHEARVVEFADLMISSGPDYVKDDWRNGLQLLAAETETSGLDSWLAAVAEHEQEPQTVLEVFFRTLKQTTINGYYTSKIGIHRELKYQGNTYLASFPGCNHPEHQS